MHILLIGPPGAGKTAVALQAKLEVPCLSHISIDECRKLLPEREAWDLFSRVARNSACCLAESSGLSEELAELEPAAKVRVSAQPGDVSMRLVTRQRRRGLTNQDRLDELSFLAWSHPKIDSLQVDLEIDTSKLNIEDGSEEIVKFIVGVYWLHNLQEPLRPGA